MGEKETLELIVSNLQMINTRLESIEKRLDGVEKRLDSVEKRLDVMEQRVSNLENEMIEVKGELKELNRRMNAVYDQVAFLTEFRTEVLMFKDDTKQKLEKINNEKEAIKDWLKDQEIQLRKLKLAQNQ